MISSGQMKKAPERGLMDNEKGLEQLHRINQQLTDLYRLLCAIGILLLVIAFRIGG
jgi:hypothetical protein